MAKRMSPDETFHTYIVLKALVEIHPDNNYGLWVENFFLSVNDYDMWEEGEPGVEYKYPWTNDVADDLAGYGIKRKGTEVYYNRQRAIVKDRYLYLDGKLQEGVLIA